MGTNSGGDSISSALFGKTRRAVLGLLFTHPGESFYVRQVVRIADVGQGAVQRELRRLHAAGIIEREQRGRQVFYCANRACPVFDELHDLMVKTAGVGEVLRQALDPLADSLGVAFVYGSVASGRESARSDVDVMIIGEASFEDIVQVLRPAEERLGREVNPTVYPPAEFRAKLASEHHFLTSVLNEPKVFLVGDAHDLEQLAGQ
ncbi:MAG: ArsR family transcriptional regulator [Candidatus Brocadiia bacterium]